MGVTYGAVLVWILEMSCPNKRRGVSAEREGDIANPSAPQTSRQGSQAAGKTESVPLHFTPLETGREKGLITDYERERRHCSASCLHLGASASGDHDKRTAECAAKLGPEILTIQWPWGGPYQPGGNRCADKG